MNKPLIALLMLALATLACAGKPVSGTVQGKRFEPAHSTPRVEQKCYVGRSVNERQTCEITMQEDRHPDQWFITVCNSESCTEVRVSQADYDKAQNGDMVSQ